MAFWYGALLEMLWQITTAVKDAHDTNVVFENAVKDCVRTRGDASKSFTDFSALTP